MTASPAIETDALTKTYRRQVGFRALARGDRGAEVVAVSRISLTVEEREVFGLLGPNGSGKTTLVKMLATLLLPTSGVARVHGLDVVRDELQVKRLIGLVASDERSFYWRLTGRQNLNFFGALYGMSSRELRRRVDEVFLMLDLGDVADARFNEYSAGLKQKLAIARGLLHRPRILFMDEPTKGLDPIAARDLLNLVRERVVGSWGCTILLATHILGEAEELCDRVAILKNGRVLCARTLEELREGFEEFEDHVLRVEHLEEHRLSEFRRIEGVLACRAKARLNGSLEIEVRVRKSGRGLSDLLRAIVETDARILGCDRKEVSLEDLFHALVRRAPAPAADREAPLC